MSVKPILFSTPMVQAILEDRKTMTRRVIKIDDPDDWRASNNVRKVWKDAEIPCCLVRRSTSEVLGVAYPKYDVGDVVWVRETWSGSYCEASCSGRTDPDECAFNRVGSWCYKYKAQYTHPIPDTIDIRWRPSIHMPRKACRLFLRVTDVRVERLQEIGSINHDDVLNEGWPFAPKTDNPTKDFAVLWDGIYSASGYGWDANPWVWVYTFERCEPPREEA